MSHIKLRLGTRASPLARWQANWVASELAARDIDVELVPITTTGDRQQTEQVADAGVGVFTKELQRALLDGRIDLAVHSLKDLPTDVVPGLALAAVPPRGPVADVLVTTKGLWLDQLLGGAVVGTGSLRRRAQLWHARPDLQMAEIRGNVDTRIRKLEAGEFDAIILAEAGLRRLALDRHIAATLPMSLMLPAPGQGALGIEAREDDTATRSLLAPLDDPATHASVIAERVLLAELEGGCRAPIAAWGRVDAAGQLQLTAAVLSHDGKERLLAEASADATDADALGQHLAAELIANGAAKLVFASRQP